MHHGRPVSVGCAHLTVSTLNEHPTPVSPLGSLEELLALQASPTSGHGIKGGISNVQPYSGQRVSAPLANATHREQAAWGDSLSSEQWCAVLTVTNSLHSSLLFSSRVACWWIKSYMWRIPG